MHTYP